MVLVFLKSFFRKIDFILTYSRSKLIIFPLSYLIYTINYAVVNGILPLMGRSIKTLLTVPLINCIVYLPAPDAVLTYSCPFPCSSPGLLLYFLQVAQTLPQDAQILQPVAQSLGLAAQNKSQDIPGDNCAAQSMLRYPHQLKYLWPKLGILNITDIGVFTGN